MTDLLELALDDLVPSFADEQPDWADVVARSTHTTRPRTTPSWPRHSRRAVAVGLAFVLVAGSAVALAGPVHDLFFGKPAPPIIKKAFTQHNEMRARMRQWQKAHGIPVYSLPLVDVANAHGVMAAKTPDGLLLLWAAPTKTGGQCWFVEFAADQVGHTRPRGGGSCTEKPVASSTIRWSTEWTAAHPTLNVLSGRLVTNAAVVRVWSRHGKARTIPVIDRYFLAAFPRALGTPIRLTALDRKGHVVANYSGPHS